MFCTHGKYSFLLKFPKPSPKHIRNRDPSSVSTSSWSDFRSVSRSPKSSARKIERFSMCPRPNSFDKRCIFRTEERTNGHNLFCGHQRTKRSAQNVYCFQELPSGYFPKSNYMAEHFTKWSPWIGQLRKICYGRVGGWKHYKSKDWYFVHRKYTCIFSQLRKNIFSRSKNVFRDQKGISSFLIFLGEFSRGFCIKTKTLIFIENPENIRGIPVKNPSA